MLFECKFLLVFPILSKRLSTEAATKDEDYHNIIKNTEKPVGKEKKFYKRFVKCNIIFTAK